MISWLKSLFKPNKKSIKRKRLTEDEKGLILELLTVHSPKDVAYLTGRGVTTIYRIIKENNGK